MNATPEATRVLAPSETIALPESAALTRARVLAHRVKERGGRAFLVGGFVRDALLGLSPKDADIEVYGLEAEELRRVLSKMGRVNCVGESFRVYKLAWHDDEKTRHELDVSLPRRDTKIGDGHRGFQVVGDPDASFEDACRRRDFTINAMLCDPLTGAIIDPFGGRADLESLVLRAVDAAHFAEDSLRVLRAAQFAARFAFIIDSETAELCRSIDLSDLPRERIWGEWEKLLLKAQPSLGLGCSQQLGILEKLFPYLEEAMQKDGGNLCRRADRAAGESYHWPIEKKKPHVPLESHRKLALILAAICTFLSTEDSVRFLDTLNVHSISGYPLRESVLSLVTNRSAPVELWERSKQSAEPLAGELRRLSGRCEPRLLFHLIRAFGHRKAAAWMLHSFRELGVENGPPAPLLLGRHLLEMGLAPGPRIGQITRAVYELQLDGKVRVLADALQAARALL